MLINFDDHLVVDSRWHHKGKELATHIIHSFWFVDVGTFCKLCFVRNVYGTGDAKSRRTHFECRTHQVE